MPEWAKRSITASPGLGACPDDAIDALQRFLRVAAGDVFLHAVENLLDIDPDVAGADRFGLAALEIFREHAADFLIITAEDFRNVGVFGFDVENRPPLT